MISKKSKYGLKALMFLARRSDQGPVLIADLARQEQLPRKFLELILLELKNNGILQSRKGKGGGYLLAKRPEQISVGEVLRVLDGSLALLPCVEQTGSDNCDEADICGLRAVMQDVQQEIDRILDHTSLTGLVDRTDSLIRSKNQNLEYSI
jgi:Rrf2 family protein